MPHYKDGTEAKIGDKVRGISYNAASKGYDPEKGVEGVVTEVRPGPATAGGCTLTVSFLQPVGGQGYYGLAFRMSPSGPLMYVEQEYGDTVGFEKIN